MTIDQMIASAEVALHKLLTGSQAQEVRNADGRTLRFTPADADKLRSYIAELKSTKAGTPVRGAIGVIF